MGQRHVERDALGLVDAFESPERKLGCHQVQAFLNAFEERHMRFRVGRNPADHVQAGAGGCHCQLSDIVAGLGQRWQIGRRRQQPLFNDGRHHGDRLQTAGHLVPYGRCQPAQQRVPGAFCALFQINRWVLHQRLPLG